VGIVKYIDYETDWMPQGNAFYNFLHKTFIRTRTRAEGNNGGAANQEWKARASRRRGSFGRLEAGRSQPANLSDLHFADGTG
jgi:hypothetical protein